MSGARRVDVAIRNCEIRVFYLERSVGDTPYETHRTQAKTIVFPLGV